jgi:N-acetylglucosaminyl-diphospho-decaprenol L-rhamnosyltransferase
VRPGASPKVSLSLLNYRGAAFLPRCLAAIRALDPAPQEVIAVDNASPDGSGELLRAELDRGLGVPSRYLAAGANLGYAAGHNLAARHARGEYLAFLNVTAEPEPAWLSLAGWLDGQPDVAFAQTAIFHRSDPTRLESLGSIYRRSGSFSVVGRNLREPRPPPAAPPYVGEITSVLGAAFVARRAVFEALGGFDASMFMYFEETDLCWRGWLNGHRSACWFDAARPTRVFHTVHGTHPNGFDVARFFERNRTLSMFRNLEGRTLPWLLPQVGRVVGEQARHPARLLRYAGEVARELPASAVRRRRIQAGRSVPDRRLFAIAPPPDLSRWFA